VGDQKNVLERYILEIPAVNPLYNDIALIQDVDADESFILNGNFYQNSFLVPSFIARGYSRNLVFSSTDNLSAANITINGTQNGMGVSETLTGPNVGIVESVKFYDTITSITTDTDLTNISVSGGLVVITRPLRTNYTSPNFNLVCYGLTVCNPQNGAGAGFDIFATQIFISGVDLNLQLDDQPAFGINALVTGSGNPLYTYNLDDAENISYAFWDAFLVRYTFTDVGQLGRVFFPLIGR
jgi:hypothetical protein